MVEIIGLYIADVLLSTVVLYILVIIIDILLKISTGKNQSEPNILILLCMVLLADLIVFLFGLIS